jgi:hypothetical protein
MIRPFRDLVFLALITSLLIACKKKETVTFPVTVYLTGMVKTSDVRLFTNRTEIKDTTVINHYIAGSQFFNLPTDSLNPSYHITFESEDTAVFFGTSYKFSVSKSSGLIVFYSKPTTVLIDPTDRLSVLADTLLKYKNKKIPVPQGTNLMKYLTKEVRVAHGDYIELDLSLITFRIVSYGGYLSEMLENELYEGAMSAFWSNDTVAVQSYSFHLRTK